MGSGIGKARTVAGIAAAVTGLAFFGGLIAGAIGASALIVLLVLAGVAVAVATWRGLRLGPRWLSGALGGLTLLLGALAVESTAGLFDSLFSLGALVWTGAGLLPLVPARYLSLPVATVAPAAPPPSASSLIYRRAPSPTYRLVLYGAAVCFVALFFQWQSPEASVSMNLVERGSVTLFKNQYNETVGKVDSTYHAPDYTTTWSGGASGFEVEGPFVVLLILGYLAAGFVGLGASLPDWLRRYGPPAGLGLLALCAVGALLEPGLSLGSLIFLVGAGLAAYGGWLTYSPTLHGGPG